MGPLHDAALMGKLEEVVRLVREEGTDINQRNAQGEMPVHRAACNARGTPVLAWLLQQPGVDINATNHEGRTALHACYANAAHAEMLLAAGADPAVKEKKHPHTAFLHAVYNGYNDVVAVMLKRLTREQLEASDGQGQGPLALAMGRMTSDHDVDRLALLLDPTVSPISPMAEGPLLLRDCKVWLRDTAKRANSPNTRPSTSTALPAHKAIIGQALTEQRTALTLRAVALLEAALASRDVVYHLCRARVAVDAATAWAAGNAEAVPACLRGRVAGPGAPRPLPGLVVGEKREGGDGDRRYMAVLSFALGLEERDGAPATATATTEGGQQQQQPHLPRELFEELTSYMKGVATWADPDYNPYREVIAARRVAQEAERERKRARGAAAGVVMAPAISGV